MLNYWRLVHHLRGRDADWIAWRRRADDFVVLGVNRWRDVAPRNFSDALGLQNWIRPRQERRRHQSVQAAGSLRTRSSSTDGSCACETRGMRYDEMKQFLAETRRAAGS